MIDDDLILTDSHVILMHLCEKHQKEDSQLWPREYKERMKVTNMLLFEGTLIFRRDSEMLVSMERRAAKEIEREGRFSVYCQYYNTCVGLFD